MKFMFADNLAINAMQTAIVCTYFNCLFYVLKEYIIASVAVNGTDEFDHSKYE